MNSTLDSRGLLFLNKSKKFCSVGKISANYEMDRKYKYMFNIV